MKLFLNFFTSSSPSFLLLIFLFAADGVHFILFNQKMPFIDPARTHLRFLVGGQSGKNIQAILVVILAFLITYILLLIM